MDLPGPEPDAGLFLIFLGDSAEGVKASVISDLHLPFPGVWMEAHLGVHLNPLSHALSLVALLIVCNLYISNLKSIKSILQCHVMSCRIIMHNFGKQKQCQWDGTDRF
jgi:hypothetical protein